MNQFQSILVEVADYIAIITINRPDALNALSVDVLNELYEAFTILKNDQSTGVIIITGAGEKAFIAGADIKYMQKLDKEGALEFGKLGQTLTVKIESSSKPVIAAVNGYALGGGCELSLACHVRIASENAIFGQPEVKLGLIPGWGGTQRLPRIVGKGLATELIISGHNIDVQEAFRIGLVNKVVPPHDLLTTAKDFAALILKNSPNAVAESLRCINDAVGKTITEGLSNELESFSNLFENNETREGLTAFVEKRPPKFRD
jgi:enoyl-CoA hydratase